MTRTAVTSQGFRFAENGAKIRRARELTGLGKEKFADQVGTTRRHMIRLENGEHLPSGPLRDRIVEVTGTEERIESSDDQDEEAQKMAFLADINRRIEELRGGRVPAAEEYIW